MSIIAVYTSPAKGHLFPLVPTLLELMRRGQQVHVRTLANECASLERLGIHATAITPEVEALTLRDYQAKTPMSAANATFGTWLARAVIEVSDVRDLIAQTKPDLLYVDINCWGAMAAAEASGLPFAIFSPYFLNLRLPGRPPFGLGLPPARSWLGRLRDRMLWAITGLGMRPHVARLNRLRSTLSLPPLSGLDALTTHANRVVVYTAKAFEYDHGHWPETVRFVGAGNWEPAAETEPSTSRPLVLVTGSTEFQDDSALVRTALAALASEDVDVVATTGATDPAVLGPIPANARVHQFLPHGPLLARANLVVCHGGMGITQKALSAGVPVCVVPWGRDQHDVAEHVRAAGAGWSLSKRKLTVANLRTALSAARDHRAGARRLAEAFASAGGPPAAADALVELLAAKKPGPGVSESPAVGSFAKPPTTLAASEQ